MAPKENQSLSRVEMGLEVNGYVGCEFPILCILKLAIFYRPIVLGENMIFA